jgi:hypothetical protein
MQKMSLARGCLALGFCLVLSISRGESQVSDPKASSNSPEVGLHLAVVPEALYAHLPQLPQGRGVLVEKITPGSIADKAGFRRYDVLLSVGGKPFQKDAQFFNLIRQNRFKKTPVEVLRQGTPLTLTLSLMPDEPPFDAKSLIKPDGPPAITVETKPLDDGKLRVTLTYFSDLTGKLERVTCAGTLPEIEKTVRDLGANRRMSPRVQNLADVALQRIRLLKDPSSAP